MKDREIFGALIAGAIVVGFLAFAIFAGIHPLPQANREILNTIVGILNSALVYVVGYYFGSSRSAERQQAHIDAITPAAQPSVAEVTANPGKPRVTVPPPRSTP